MLHLWRAVGNILEENELDVKQTKLSRRVAVVLADPPHNVQRDREDDPVEYDTLSLIYIKDMARIAEDVKKPEAQSHVICSAL